MTKRRYKPYRTNKQKKQRRLLNVAMILIALIVGFVVLIKMYHGKEELVPVSDPGAGEERLLTEILPGHETSGEPATPAPQPPAQPEPPTVPAPPASEPAAPPVVVASPAADPASPDTAVDDESSNEARELVRRAIDLDQAGKIIAARDLLNSSLDKRLSSQLRAQIKTKMTKLADKWLFSRDVYESDNLTEYYLVQPGDRLAVIAKRYKVPYEVLMELNGIARPELLQAGQKLKVIKGPFNVVVYKSTFTMDLFLQQTYIKTYRVGLGKQDKETPTGNWRVKPGGKLIRPKWTDNETGRVYAGSDPDYPLGSRWIAIEGLDDSNREMSGYALHGTKDPETIGTRSSRGCIRLDNDDVIEVYNLMEEVDSKVVIYD